MILRLLISIASRNIWRNIRRTVLTLLAISLGVWSSVALAALARGMAEQLTRDTIYTLTGHLKIFKPDYETDPVVDHNFNPNDPKLLPILNSSEVEHWAARVQVPAVILSERESTGVTLLGIDPEKEIDLSFIGEGVNQGEMLSGPDDKGIIIGEKLAETLKTRIGKRIVILTQGFDGQVADRGFRVKGLFKAELESTEKAFVFIGMQTAQKLLKLSENVSEISILSQDRENLLPSYQQAKPCTRWHRC